MLECAKISENPVLGIFAHGAGVKNYNVGFFALVRHFVAHLLQHTRQPLRVVHVLLAAVGLDQCKALTAAFFHKLHYFVLARYFRAVNAYILL